MKFSLKAFLIASLIAGLAFALSWPKLSDSLIEYSVIESRSTALQNIGYVKSAECFRATGYPTIIYGRAWSDRIPHLDGDNVPFVVVVNHNRSAKIDFESLIESGSGVFANTTFRVGNQDFSLTHGISRNDDLVVEELNLNGKKIDINGGRLIQIDINNGEYDCRQSDVGNLPRTVFDWNGGSDRERVKRVLEWWRATERLTSRRGSGG